MKLKHLNYILFSISLVQIIINIIRIIHNYTDLSMVLIVFCIVNTIISFMGIIAPRFTYKICKRISDPREDQYDFGSNFSNINTGILCVLIVSIVLGLIATITLYS